MCTSVQGSRRRCKRKSPRSCTCTRSSNKPPSVQRTRRCIWRGRAKCRCCRIRRGPGNRRFPPIARRQRSAASRSRRDLPRPRLGHQQYRMCTFDQGSLRRYRRWSRRSCRCIPWSSRSRFARRMRRCTSTRRARGPWSRRRRARDSRRARRVARRRWRLAGTSPPRRYTFGQDWRRPGRTRSRRSCRYNRSPNTPPYGRRTQHRTSRRQGPTPACPRRRGRNSRPRPLVARHQRPRCPSSTWREKPMCSRCSIETELDDKDDPKPSSGAPKQFCGIVPQARPERSSKEDRQRTAGGGTSDDLPASPAVDKPLDQKRARSCAVKMSLSFLFTPCSEGCS